MMRVFILLCLLPVFQMIVQKEKVKSGSSTYLCAFKLKYTPSAVDLRKSLLKCSPKSKRTFKVENYDLKSKDPTQPCEFKLTFLVKMGTGKFIEAEVKCKLPTTLTTPAETTTTTSPEVINKQDALLASPEVKCKLPTTLTTPAETTTT